MLYHGPMTTKTPKPTARLLDQFYTSRAIVPALLAATHDCVNGLGLGPCTWLEPSAGDGAFLEHMPQGSVGLDLAPARPDIVKTDFLSWSAPNATSWIVAGNPPFGKNSSLAIRFFNHAATFAKVIAFIVPKTFEKVSVQNRLDPNFTLQKQIEIDPLSFVFEGQPVSVPCVFQIWVRSSTPRSKMVHPKSHKDFSLVKDKDQADFAFQRVGAAAGKIKDMTAAALAPASHHFIRVTNRKQIKNVRKRLESIDFSTVKSKTAGNPSISLTELVQLYQQACDR